MDNFRRWHELKENVSFYNEEMNVSFNQCDKNHRLSLYDILKISSDTAVTDYDIIGLTWQKFHDLKTVFVVSRISFRFHKFPVASQNIRVKTWNLPSPSVCKALRFLRCRIRRTFNFRNFTLALCQHRNAQNYPHKRFHRKRNSRF